MATHRERPARAWANAWGGVWPAARAAGRRLLASRPVDALAKTILVFAAIHLLVVGGAAVGGRVELLNAFHILDLDALFPALGVGPVNLLASHALVLAVYALAYRYLTRPNPRTV